MKKFVRLTAKQQVDEIEAKRNFVRMTVKKLEAQIEMARLQQTLAGNAFVYSIAFN